MNVFSFVRYTRSGPLSAGDRNAAMLVRAIKAMSGWQPSGAGKLCRACSLDTRNIEQVLGWFGTLGALVLRSQNLQPPVVIVPIPSSGRVFCSQGRPVSRTFWLADAIVKRSKGLAVICDPLSWDCERKPSHCGGSRDAASLCQRLVLSLPVPDGTVVLVDDVLTTGSHLLAAASRLAAEGIRCRQGICFARSARSQGSSFGVDQVFI